MNTDASKDDLLTVAAIGIIAMCAVTFDHEALGHGGACVALGGHIQVLTSSVFHCDLKSRWIAPAGPAGNLLMGMLALVAVRFVPARLAGLRLFLLLMTAFSYFWEGGYAVQAMIKRDGDLYFAGQDFLGEPSANWRIAGVVAGLCLFVFAIAVTGRALRRLWPVPARARRVARTVWLAASAAAIVAALACNIDRAHNIHDAFAEIGLASLPLLFIPWGRPMPDAASVNIERSWIAVALACIIFAVFAATLGHGIGSRVM